MGRLILQRNLLSMILVLILAESSLVSCKTEKATDVPGCTSEGQSNEQNPNCTDNGDSETSGWNFKDNGSVNGSQIAAYPKAAILNSKLYSIWHTADGVIQFGQYQGDTSSNQYWSTSLTNLNSNSSSDAYFPNPYVFNSKIYVAWYENNPINQIRVKVYNGNDLAPSFSSIDGNGANGLNANPATHAFYPTLTSFNSKLYITWVEGSPYFKVRIAVYNGNDNSPSWSFVDGGGVNGLGASSKGTVLPQMREFNGKLYLTWSESIVSNGNAGHTIFVYKYNGNNGAPSWTSVSGSGLNVDSSKRGIGSQLIEFNSKLYIGWAEYSAVGSQIRIKVYNDNDSSPGWTLVDGSASGLNVNPSAEAQEIHLAVHQSSLLAVWKEYTGSSDPYLLRAQSYNGNDSAPAWSLIGGPSTSMNCSSGHATDGPQLISFSGGLYALWSGQCPTHEYIRFQKYNGSL